MSLLDQLLASLGGASAPTPGQTVDLGLTPAASDNFEAPGNPLIWQPSSSPVLPTNLLNLSNDPMDGAAQEQATLNAMPGMDALISLLNRNEAAPGNPMDVRVAAINREHNKNGIYASKDSKGQAVFTNIAPNSAGSGNSGKPASGTTVGSAAPVFGTNQSAVGSNVRDLLNQLKGTEDPNVMRALQGQLNEAMAMETAKAQSEARTFAENKVGVPALEAAYNKSIQLDLASPGGFPGRPPSDNTRQALADLEKARGEADREIKSFLDSNATVLGLKAMTANANSEIQRIQKIADHKDSMKFSAEQNLANWKQKQDLQLQEEAKGIPEDVKMNLRILNPMLATAPDTDLMSNLNQAEKIGNKKYLEAVRAPAESLPRFAAEGNDVAKTLLVTKEEKLGIKPADTLAKMNAIQDLMRNPAKLEAGMVALSGPVTKDSKSSVAKMMADLQAKEYSGTKEDKAMVSNARFEMAKKLITQQLTNAYSANVATWDNPDPELQAAILSSKKVTGKTDLPNVVAAYMNGDTGPVGVAKVNKLIQLMTDSARKTSGSAFGTIDYMPVANEIRARAMPGFLSQIHASIQKTFGKPMDNAGLATHAATPAMALSGIINDFVQKKVGE